MNMKQTFMRLGAIAFLPASLLMVSIPTGPAVANDFRNCISKMIDNGVTEENASQACAQALVPEDLSRCVANIRRQTQINSEDILSACYRVRRPRDLASCVVDINRNQLRNFTPETPEDRGNRDLATTALDNCRRSLLPARYSQCVIGFTSVVEKQTPEKAMEVCISAESINQDFSPNAPQ